MAGETLDWRRRLSMSLVWGRSLSCRKFGNVLDTPARIDRKWALKVWIVPSAVLRRCMLGGDELEGCFPLFFNLEFVRCTALIVEYLEVDVMSIIL